MDDREFRVMNLKSKWINAAHNYWNMVPHADNKWRNSANNCQLKPLKLWVAPAMYRLYRASAAMGTCTWNWRFKVKQQNANSNRFSMPCMLYSDPNIQTFHPSLWGTGHPSPWHVPHWHAPRLHPIRKFKPGTRTRQLQMMPYLWVLFSFQHSNAQKKNLKIHIRCMRSLNIPSNEICWISIKRSFVIHANLRHMFWAEKGNMVMFVVDNRFGNLCEQLKRWTGKCCNVAWYRSER